MLFLLLIPLFFAGFLAYHLSRQEPRRWRQFTIVAILSSSVPAAVAGYRLIEATVPGMVIGVVAGCLTTGMVMVMGRQLYDGLRRQATD